MTSPNTPESGMPATPETVPVPQPPAPAAAPGAEAPEALVTSVAADAGQPAPTPAPDAYAPPAPFAPAPLPPRAPRRRTGLIAVLTAVGLVLLLGGAFGITYAVRTSGGGGSAAPVVNTPIKPSADPNAPLVIGELLPEELTVAGSGKSYTLEQIGVWEEDCEDLGTDEFGRGLEDGCEYRVEFAYRTDDREYLVAGHLLVYGEDERAEEVAESMLDEEFALQSLRTRSQAKQAGWMQVRYQSLKRYVFAVSGGSMDGFRTEEAITDDENVVPLVDGLLSKVRGKIFWGK